MFNWESDYNYDLEIAAILIQFILIIHYCSRKNMPIRQSKLFICVMFANFAMILFDIVACELIAIYDFVPLSTVYSANIIYFLGFAIRSWALFSYTKEASHAFYKLKRWPDIIMLIPMILYSVLVISSSKTGAVFRIDPQIGYVSGPFYKYIYYIAYFYIAISVICIFASILRNSIRLTISMLSYNFILCFGLYVRKMFQNTLVMGLFSVVAIIIIYLTALNPDSYRDKKIGSFNNYAFEYFVTECIQRKQKFHLILISISNYDAVKTVFGYHQLVAALRMAAEWMTKEFEDYDLFYFGNGNFALISKKDYDDRHDLEIKEIRRRFKHTWKTKGAEVSLSPHMIIVPENLMPSSFISVTKLIDYSFTNKEFFESYDFEIITEDIIKKMRRREQVEKAIARALKNHTVQAYYQPIYSPTKKKIVGCEALARIIDTELGFIPPSEFIIIAEQNGSIMELGRQIFIDVCKFLKANDVKALGIEFVNVNLSPAQCMNDQLAFELMDIAADYDVPMGLIDFEITETSIEDILKIRTQMEALNQKGATFSLDDFGTGTSNITRLLSLPLSVIKLDMNVVWSYFKGKSKILPDLIRMFKNSELKIVVEGVEDKEMCDKLAEMGCDYEQGYYFSKPLPGDEFIKYLAAEHDY